MSPKRRGRKDDRHNRPSSQGKGASGAAVQGGRKDPPPPEELFRDMVRGSRELLAIRDPLDAELFVSEILGTWWGQRLPDGDVEEVIGEALVDFTARSAEPAALALLCGITHLGTVEQARKAERAANRLSARGLRRPPWAERIGRVRHGDCWVSRDAYGDQDSVVVTFETDGDEDERGDTAGAGTDESAHALVVLLDYNLGGMVKDAWCTTQVDVLLDHCRQQAVRSALMEFESLDPAYARAMLTRALQETDRAKDPPVSKGFPAYHAFLRARLRALPEGAVLPGPPEFSVDRRAALAAEFLASPEAESLSDTAAAARCADLIVDHGCNADLGRPCRVSPIKAELFLLDWLPRKVMLRPEDREAMPHVLTAWVRWCGRREGLPREGIAETLDAVWEGTRRFEDTYGDPSKLGLDTGTVERLVPDGDLEALPRRAFAVPLLTGEHHGIDLGALDPAEPADRRILVAAEHPAYPASALRAGGDSEREGTDREEAGSDEAGGEPDGPGGRHTGSAGFDHTDRRLYDHDSDVDPDLHLSLHEVVATQLWKGEPPQVWETAQRLLDLGYERHHVLHMLMATAGRSMHGDPRHDRTHDTAHLRAALDELPGWWEDLKPPG